MCYICVSLQSFSHCDSDIFCQMAGYAAGRGNITISDAEKAFGNRAKKKNPEL